MSMMPFILFWVITLGGTLLWSYLHELWFAFRWRVLGKTPWIFLKRPVERTVIDCVVEAMAKPTPQSESDDEKRERLARMFRDAITTYTMNFSRHLAGQLELDGDKDQ
jgi:hypothetical protein